MSETVTRELLQQIIDGCEGVTPGPWLAQDVSLQPDDVGSAYIVGANLDGLVGAAHAWPTEIDDGDFERVEANAAHIARLDPATVKAMATLALQALDREGVRVKPLEWHERVTGAHRAETIVGDYRVWTHHEADGVVFWQLSDGGIKAAGQGTEAECFAAAQADYEQRIRSTLTAAPSNPVISDAARDVLAERQRQVEAEGWTPDHDDQHRGGSLATAAACYAAHDQMRMEMRSFGNRDLGRVPELWPRSWDYTWFKPTNRRRDLIKAGALILAEIERLDRAAALSANPQIGSDKP